MGGDRICHHNYEQHYALLLEPKLELRDPVIFEVDILTGTGLAPWSPLFPEARIFGLDVDLSYMRGNLENLRARGAFAIVEPQLLELDRFAPETSIVQEHLAGRKVDIVIDDGFHSNESGLNTIGVLQPLLANDFVHLSKTTTK